MLGEASQYWMAPVMGRRPEHSAVMSGGALRAWYLRGVSPSFFTECERCLGPPGKFKLLTDMEFDNTENFSYFIQLTRPFGMHLGGNKNCKVLCPFHTAVTPFSARGLSPQVQKPWRTLVCNCLTTLFCFHCACMRGLPSVLASRGVYYQ